MADDPPPAATVSAFGGTVRAEPGAIPTLLGYAGVFAVVLGALGWGEWADRRRPERFTLFPCLAAGGLAAGLVLAAQSLAGGAVAWGVPFALAGAALAVPAVSPWSAPPPPPPKKHRLSLAA